MSVRLRTLTFIITLGCVLLFALVFTFHGYRSTVDVLREEIKTSLTLSRESIEHEIDLSLRLMDNELHGLTGLYPVHQAIKTGKDVSLRQFLFTRLVSVAKQRYDFIVLTSLDNKTCILVKSQLEPIGTENCETIYNTYRSSYASDWRAFQNGEQVLLAKDYLVSDSNQKVIGRLIGGIKLSDNVLLLNKLINRAANRLSSARITLNDQLVTEFSTTEEGVQSNWLDEKIVERYRFPLNQYNPNMYMQLEASGRSIRSLGVELFQLMVAGIFAAFVLMFFIAIVTSVLLDRQLKGLLSYIHSLVSDHQQNAWNGSSIEEFNEVKSEIDQMFEALLDQREELDSANIRLENLIEEKRILLHDLISSQEREKNVLARELHDQLGQLLTAVRIEAVLLEMNSQNPEEILQHSERIKKLVAEMYETVYDRITALRPTELDDLGLAQSIRQIPTIKSLQQTGVRVQLSLEENTLPEGVDIQLYRIVQEALTNALKHSLASEVIVRLHKLNNYLVLCVSDDGIGIKNMAESRKNYGLLGIQERCETIGAELDIQHEKGVTIEVRLKLDDSGSVQV